VAFTINHVAAVTVPVAFGALGMIDPAIIFWRLAHLFVSVPRHPAPGHETTLAQPRALPAE
jgi:hypothetical protein